MSRRSRARIRFLEEPEYEGEKCSANVRIHELVGSKDSERNRDAGMRTGKVPDVDGSSMIEG